VRSVKFFTTEEEWELLLRWAARRGPHLREAEIDAIEARAAVLAELLERWEPVGVEAALRCVAEQGREDSAGERRGVRSFGGVLDH
jgi:hypothetical protein